MDEDTQPDLARTAIGFLGVVLLCAGVGLALWAFSVVHQALYHPMDIPLLELAVGSGDDGFEFNVSKDTNGASVRGSPAVVLVMVVGFLLLTFGAIVSALISGGLRLLGDATWRRRWTTPADRRHLRTTSELQNDPSK